MSLQYSIESAGVQASPWISEHLMHQLTRFLGPVVIALDQLLDKRLVRTFLQTIAALLEFRHRANGLLLSELGAYLDTPAHAPAGTKRLSNLLRSSKWAATLIEHFLWQHAITRLGQLQQAGEEALAVWDESVLEKPESLKLEGLCAVRSSKARRLKRIKPGYYNPPGGRPVCVPGMHWLAVLLLGRQGPAPLAAMYWWTTRGKFASKRRQEESWLLGKCMHDWGRHVIHIFDRGFAGSPWLGECLELRLRFILRWGKRYLLQDQQGSVRKAWQITRGKRSWAQRQVWDARRQQWFQAGVLAVPVRHPDYRTPLWLVVSRPGKGRPPWYRLTEDPIETEEQAWQVVFAYARRWQIELTWRYDKTELAFESPRLWRWEHRLKLLLMASLAYAFLLSLLDEADEELRRWLLRCWCHRTGKRCREAAAPLYRLRWALSRLWLAHPPALLASRASRLLNSG